MDISVILNCHSEGILVHRTIRGLEQMRAYAYAHGITTEVILVLDKADQKTRDYFNEHQHDYQVYETSFGDLGSARNFGVEKASGKYIAFQDGDDIFSANWLTASFGFAEKHEHEQVVLHAEYAITFDVKKKDIWKRYSWNEPSYQPHTYVAFNPYDALCFTLKKILSEIKYPVAVAGSGFGYEDWHWNSTVEARGYKHYVVPETVLFIRRKKHGSLLQAHNTSRALIPYSELLEPATFMTFVEFERHDYKDPRATIFQPLPQPNIKRRGFVAETIRKATKLVYKIIRFIFKRIFGGQGERSKTQEMFVRFAKLQRRAVKILLSNPSEEDMERHPVRPVTDNVNEPLPEWLVNEWKRLNRIDPAILYSRETLADSIRYSVPDHSELGMSYYDFCKQYEGEYDHVFLVPWLKMGGADLVAIHFINGLIKNGYAKRILLITTEDESEWLRSIHYSVKVVEFSKKFNYLPPEERELLLAKVLIQFKIRTLHLINSKLGYQVLEKYGKPISTAADIYVHVFCEEYDRYDNLVGYAFEELNAVYPYVKRILTDNKRFIRLLVEMYGYDPGKFQCVYQPVDSIAGSVKVSSPDSKLRILWSGRFDKQKRPDILINIAKKLAHDRMIEIDVYGKTVLDGNFNLKELEALPNINYKGVYSSWGSLDHDSYDIFLYTSGYDGVPNVVLEALSSGMILIVPDQGGLTEVVKDSENGFVIDSNENINGYVEKILIVKNNRQLKEQFFRSTKQMLEAYHSTQKFDEVLAMFRDEKVKVLPPASVDGPLISIVLPVYNAQKYLAESIRSILDQTYKNFELLIFNDGSTDDSDKIIQSFKDERITVIRQKANRGLIFNLNQGLEMARGKYIARMDADDIALPERLARQVEFMEKNPDVGICGTWFRLFEENGTSRTVMHPVNHDHIVMTLIFRYCALGHPTVMIRKNVISEARYDDKYLGAEDYKLWTSLMTSTRMANLPEVLLHYRWHSTNISNTRRDRQLKLDAQIKQEGFEDFVLGRPLTSKEEELFSHMMFNSNDHVVNEDLFRELEKFKEDLMKANARKGILDTALFNKYLNLMFSSRVVKEAAKA